MRSMSDAHFIDGYVKVRKGKLFYKKVGIGKTPIIVLHGDPRLGFSYLLPQMLALASNYVMVFFDQRGSGKSQENEINSELINPQQFIEDLESLRQQLDINQFILISHSLGGPLALSYAISHANNLSALILMNSTPISVKGQEAFEIALNTRISNQLDTYFLNNLENFQKLNEKEIEQLYSAITPLLFNDKKKAENLSLQINASSMKNGDKAIQLMFNKLIPLNQLELSTLSVPTLIIHCANDAIPLWASEEIQNTIPHAKLIVLKCDHFPYIEQPKLLFKSILDFLSKIEL